MYPNSANYLRAPGCTAPFALYGSHLDPSTQTLNTAYHNYVDTGWAPNFTGDFTIAWFQKERTPNTTNGLAYMISGQGSFRMFQGGVAYNGLYLRAWGGSPADLVLGDPSRATSGPVYDLMTESQNRWVHVAIVVDATAGTGTWYIDGRPLSPTISVTAGANLSLTGNMKLGQHTGTTSSYRHDIDEFRFSTRAVPASEISKWAAVRPGESFDYVAGCQGTLASSSGPSIGKPWLMNVTGPANSGGIISVGLSRTLLLGAIPLPIDLGLALPPLAGCNFASSMDFVLPMALNAQGAGSFVIPIPNDPGFINLAFYNQGILVGGGSTMASTNGLGGIVGN
jgi:hypothetical protein